MKTTLPERGIVTRKGKPVSVIILCAEEAAFKRGMKAKSKEFVEIGAEVHAKV
jgi:hypothetical protein